MGQSSSFILHARANNCGKLSKWGLSPITATQQYTIAKQRIWIGKTSHEIDH
ncbi:MAG: hypothetical protein ACRC53_08240 [Plesiomonas sp.]|uniref:hypothetical protein n=1 Tax=Plesiomonas sp. TaxID=2486279 RepID=UPI003F3EE434